MSVDKNNTKNIIIDSNSNIPLFGLDFLSVLDRGTNVLEIKTNTKCNLKCKYCFVSSGDYETNFVIELDYLLKWIKKAIEVKNCNDIEIHLAPYGEILLYPQLFQLIKLIRKIPEVSIISLQSNGLLLNEENIIKLEESGLDRLNLSLNSMDPDKCAEYCGVKKYNLSHLLKMFDLVLASKMELLVAPVWFRGINDEGIIDVIKYIKEKSEKGFLWPKLRLGIQNYLTYSTGRKIRKTKMREFGFFYNELRRLENEYKLKLKLGPKDFNIHKTIPISSPVKINSIAKVEIIRQGRWKNEYIAKYDDNWAVKVISQQLLPFSSIIKVKFIKSSLKGNLLTAVPWLK